MQGYDILSKLEHGTTYSVGPTTVLPEHQLFLDAWYAREADERIPRRSEFSPQFLSEIAGSLLIWDLFEDDARTYTDSRLRYVGPAVEVILGDITGLRLSEQGGDPMWMATREFHAFVHASRQPVLAATDSLPVPGYGYLGFSRLALPLSRDGRNVRYLLSLHRFCPSEPL